MPFLLLCAILPLSPLVGVHALRFSLLYFYDFSTRKNTENLVMCDFSITHKLRRQ